MDHVEHLRWLLIETSRFADALTGADLSLPVRACGDWDTADLARHLGSTHRWAAAAVRDGRPGDMAAGPRDPHALVAWYRDGAAERIDTLAANEPDRPCWTLAPPSSARFWSRRQVHEALVHRWDAERSQGDPGALDPILCADGIDEVVTTFAPRQVRLGRMAPLEQAVALVTDHGGWVLGPGEPRATVSAPADRLLLLLWGRLDPADPAIDVGGDGEVVAQLLQSAVVP